MKMLYKKLLYNKKRELLTYNTLNIFICWICGEIIAELREFLVVLS